MVLGVWKKQDTGVNCDGQGEELGGQCQEQQGSKEVRIYFLSFLLMPPFPPAAFNQEPTVKGEIWFTEHQAPMSTEYRKVGLDLRNDG